MISIPNNSTYCTSKFIFTEPCYLSLIPKIKVYFSPFGCCENVKNDVTNAMQDSVILNSLSLPNAFLSSGVTNDPSSIHKFNSSLKESLFFPLQRMNWKETN